ncbi:MAG: 2-succinyl-6-hydroxy-2,4-cyclohexadiene-1-carboxylate synthase [Actinomycetota bacterium]
MKLVFLHGFTQTSRSWEQVVSTLTSDTVDEMCAVDLPGHGDNPDGNVDIREMADALVAQHGTALYIGYSFGARVALHIATRHPEKTTGLVLVSGSPGIADPNERHTRAQADDQLADHIETVGVPTFIDEWLANPLFSNLNTAAAMRADRLRNTTKGLADSLRYAGTGRQESLWDYLSTVYCPTLLVTGEQDAKFRDIATKMSGLLPNCKWVSVTDAGHTVHLEQPTKFVHLLTSWLESTYAV